MRTMLVSLALVAAGAACGKKADAPTPDPKTAPAEGSGGSAGSAAPGNGSAAAGNGSAAPGNGSAAGGGSGGSAAPAGSGGSGGAAQAGSGAAAPDGSGTAGSGHAEEDVNPRVSPLCNKVLAKIVECQKDKAFLSALDEGVDANQRKLNKRFMKEVTRWTQFDADCANLAAGIEYMGFLNHWDRIVQTPDLVDSCGKLGTAINAAGGMFGGDRAN